MCILGNMTTQDVAFQTIFSGSVSLCTAFTQDKSRQRECLSFIQNKNTRHDQIKLSRIFIFASFLILSGLGGRHNLNRYEGFYMVARGWCQPQNGAEFATDSGKTEGRFAGVSAMLQRLGNITSKTESSRKQVYS